MIYFAVGDVSLSLGHVVFVIHLCMDRSWDVAVRLDIGTSCLSARAVLGPSLRQITNTLTSVGLQNAETQFGAPLSGGHASIGN
jgi:hypothetical protein